MNALLRASPRMVEKLLRSPDQAAVWFVSLRKLGSLLGGNQFMLKNNLEAAKWTQCSAQMDQLYKTLRQY
jgi:hypothetical protein